MKIRTFICGDAPEMRDIQELGDRVKELSDIDIEILDIEKREGKEVAEVYDIYATPSLLVTTDDGAVINSWIGKVPAEFELKNVIMV